MNKYNNNNGLFRAKPSLFIISFGEDGEMPKKKKKVIYAEKFHVLMETQEKLPISCIYNITLTFLDFLQNTV